MIDEAIKEIMSGGVVCAPTGTLYGLVALPESAGRVRELKGRPTCKNLLLNALRAADVRKLTKVSALEEALLARPDVSVSFSDDLAVRIPDDPVMIRLLSGCGGLLLSTSANRSGDAPCRTSDECRRAFPGLIVLEEERAQSGLPSTIVRVADGRAEVLRAGAAKL